MSVEQTTIAVQRYLDDLAEDSAVVRSLMEQSVRRLHLLCSTMLHRSYPRLTQPPLNLQVDELLGAVTERLLKAMREVRPGTVRQFFALANQHIRWELNDLARRLDERPPFGLLDEGAAPISPSSESTLSANCRRILAAIESLPADEQEVFSLVRVQGMTQTDAAQVLGIALVTVKRRLNRGLQRLAEQLTDLRPN